LCENEIDIEDEEKPQTNDVKYMIEAGAQQLIADSKQKSGEKGQNVED